MNPLILEKNIKLGHGDPEWLRMLIFSAHHLTAIGSSPAQFT